MSISGELQDAIRGERNAFGSSIPEALKRSDKAIGEALKAVRRWEYIEKVARSVEGLTFFWHASMHTTLAEMVDEAAKPKVQCGAGPYHCVLLKGHDGAHYSMHLDGGVWVTWADNINVPPPVWATEQLKAIKE